MSQENFDKVRDYLERLDLTIVEENVADTLFIVADESRGIANLLIDCEDELLVFEQMIFEMPGDRPEIYKRLLQLNRELVHGAFALDGEGRRVLFRDTLQLANLDFNEIDATINALALALAACGGELIAFAKSA